MLIIIPKEIPAPAVELKASKKDENKENSNQYHFVWHCGAFYGLEVLNGSDIKEETWKA